MGIGTETSFLIAFAYLVVIVKGSHYLIAEPDMRTFIDQLRVTEQAEIVVGITISLDQIFQLIGNIIDP